MEEEIENMSWKQIASIIIDQLSQINENLEYLSDCLNDVNNTVKRIQRDM